MIRLAARARPGDGDVWIYRGKTVVFSVSADDGPAVVALLVELGAEVEDLKTHTTYKRRRDDG